MKKLSALAVLMTALFIGVSATGRDGAFKTVGRSEIDTDPGKSIPVLSESGVNKPEKLALAKSYGKTPLLFIPNRGQLDRNVHYLVEGHNIRIYFTSEGLTYVLYARNRHGGKTPSMRAIGERPDIPQDSRKSWALKLDFVNANREVTPEILEEAPTVISYIRGGKDNWKTGIRAGARIVYRDLWPGIDLVYSGTVDRLKYEFVVRPGADPARIKLAYRGAENLAVEDDGTLAIATPLGNFSDDVPVAWQQEGDRRREVSVGYRLDKRSKKREQRYSFEVGEYDRSRTLVLDPAVIVYCGYLGGSDYDSGSGIAVDNDCRAYVTGSTNSDQNTFPVTPGAFDNVYNGSGDIFVARISADGSALEYCTYIGGSAGEWAHSIAVDSSGRVYITGDTVSSDFPTTAGSFDQVFNGTMDVYVARLSSDGSSLEYCTFLGGPDFDWGNGIAVDSSGRAHVTGKTISSKFPTTAGSFDTIIGGSGDAFVARLSSDGSSLEYSTFLGGSIGDIGYGIALDSAGRAYVTGVTNSADFPTAGDSFDTSHNDRDDAFVARLSADGTSLEYGTYLGGSSDDYGYSIAVDSSNRAYITGYTRSNQTTFPVTGDSFDTTFHGIIDAFVARLSSDGSSLDYCTYLGGSNYDFGYDIAIGGLDRAYVTGLTTSLDFPATGDSFDNTFNGINDAFVAQLSADGSSLDYCGYLGGSLSDGGESLGIAVDSFGRAYVTGETESDQTTFPVTAGFFDPSYNGSTDAFVVRIAPLRSVTYVAAGHTGGTAPVDSNSPYAAGETVTVLGPGTLERAEATFTSWNTEADGSGDFYAEGSTFTMPDSDVTLYSRWDTEQFTITALVSGGHGSATPTVQSAEVGDDAMITFTADPGFHLASLTDNGTGIVPVNEYHIYNVQEDHTVTAVFAEDVPATTYTVTANVSGGNGTATPEVQTVNPGESASIRFTAESGYHLASLIDNGIMVIPLSEYRIPAVNENHTVTARFRQDNPTIRITAPLDGATVYGPVEIKALVSDDSQVTEVLFYEETLLEKQVFMSREEAVGITGTQAAREYTYLWDSSQFPFGLHTLRVVARYANGQSESDEVVVNVATVKLHLNAKRSEARAWMITRHYGEIYLAVENQGASLATVRLKRRGGSGEWETVKELPASELQQNTTWSYQDKYLEKETPYTYQAEICDNLGRLLAESNEITI